MIKILVLYYSRQGSTRMLAEAVAAGVGEVDGAEAVLRSTTDVSADDFIGCAGIIAGSPVYFGAMAAELKSVFDRFIGVRKKMTDKIGAAFAVGAHHSGGKETTMLSILQAMLIYNMIVVGDPFESGGHYGVACSGRPGKEALSDGRNLGNRVARLALSRAARG